VHVALLIIACSGTATDSATVDSLIHQDSAADTQDSGPEVVGGFELPTVLVNEILTRNTGSSEPAWGEPAGWIELYNPNDEAVSLGDASLSNDWLEPGLHDVHDDVVIEPGGYLVFWADGEATVGPDRLDFVLDPDGGAVGLFDHDEEAVDWVLYPSLGDDVAYARLPDGAEAWSQVAIGTPGGANADLVRRSEVVLEAGSVWAYHDQGLDLGTAWREPAYDDAAWPRGVGPLGYGDSQVTVLDYGDDSSNKRPTAYFRTTFELDDPSWVTSVTAGVQRDDGAALYLNGTEVLRTALPDGELSYDTLANKTASSTDETTYFSYEVDPVWLVAGTNVLAAEVHQVARTSSDLAFDATLELVGLSERE